MGPTSMTRSFERGGTETQEARASQGHVAGPSHPALQKEANQHCQGLSTGDLQTPRGSPRTVPFHHQAWRGSPMQANATTSRGKLARCSGAQGGGSELGTERAQPPVTAPLSFPLSGDEAGRPAGPQPWTRLSVLGQVTTALPLLCSERPGVTVLKVP